MNIIRQRIAQTMIIALMAPMLLGCASSMFTSTASPALSTPAPANANAAPPNAAFALAQATIDAGQSQLSDLSHRATAVSLNLAQAANAAAQSTKDFNQRQKMDLDYQATIVSLNIAQAAATQSVLAQQTQSASGVTAEAQSRNDRATQAADQVIETQVAQTQSVLDSQSQQTAQALAALTSYPLTATYSALAVNATERVQAQLLIYAQETQTAQANAVLAAYPLTATPYAATQAALLMQQYAREQQSFVNRVVKPMIPIVATLFLLLFVLVIILAFRQYLPMAWPRRLPFARGVVTPTPFIMIDGVLTDPIPRLHPILPSEPLPVTPAGLPGGDPVHVEIIAAAEPPVAHWLAELEDQLNSEGGPTS